MQTVIASGRLQTERLNKGMEATFTFSIVATISISHFFRSNPLLDSLFRLVSILPSALHPSRLLLHSSLFFPSFSFIFDVFVWGKIFFPEKLMVAHGRSDIQNNFILSGSPTGHYRFHKRPPLLQLLSQMNENSHLVALFLKDLFLYHPSQYLGLQNGPFPAPSSAKFCDFPHFAHAPRPILCVQDYKLQASSLCTLIQPLVTSPSSFKIYSAHCSQMPSVYATYILLLKPQTVICTNTKNTTTNSLYILMFTYLDRKH